MYIEKLRLQNFKGFTDIELYFHPQMSVLVGKNGSGKTSIMEAAAIAISTMLVRLDGVSGKSIDKSQARLQPYSPGSTPEVHAQYPVTISAEAVLNSGKKLSWTRSLNKATGSTTVSGAKDMTQFGVSLQDDLRKGDTSLVLPIIAYYGTMRLWDYHREKQTNVFERNNRINGYIDCVDGTANVKLMVNWFTKMTIQKYQNQELGLGKIPELEAVYRAMEECYSRITGQKDVKIQYSIGTRELEIAYPMKDGKYMRMPLNQLSDGYKSTISLVADIAYRMSVLNPQFLGDVCKETDGIICIDEVDLHLHPQWQERILGDLMAIFPKVQFIVSTHAPAVINTVKSENIILLDGDKAYAPSGEVHGRDTNSIIEGIMEASSRPRTIQALFSKFYAAIDNQDLSRAKKVLHQIKGFVGEDDPEVTRSTIKLNILSRRRKE